MIKMYPLDKYTYLPFLFFLHTFFHGAYKVFDTQPYTPKKLCSNVFSFICRNQSHIKFLPWSVTDDSMVCSDDVTNFNHTNMCSYHNTTII